MNHRTARQEMVMAGFEVVGIRAMTMRKTRAIVGIGARRQAMLWRRTQTMKLLEVGFGFWRSVLAVSQIPLERT